MWATSRSEEPATVGLLQLGGSPVQPVQGADHVAQSAWADAGVEHRGLQVTMAEQLLNVRQLRTVLKQVGGEAVPQSVGGSWRVQAGFVAEPPHHPLDDSIIDRLLRRLTAKQPSNRTVAPEVTPQDIQQ